MENVQEKIFESIKEMNDNDLRIGQIISNVFYELSKDGTDPFYVTDSKLLECIESYKNQ